MIFNPYQQVKNYQEYTETEIIDMLEREKNPFLYDYLIDRLYFYNVKKRNTKKEEYNILSARTMYKREHNEKELNLNYFSNYGI
ncbi:hypothetical protein SAMN02745671_02549 [Anaerovibrio lipolyticus DSM 3074]|uniref:Uncharacterized protein n=1 Tax=Anaerovibrio lipolyticus DSM 3074 TaxID=1120997 RepID=A0A1M6G7C0_9FIRM|nr:hypothetical protein [Anaerovibrio lipolyticus]SHJ05809.1 hypothetical protein SAMN02745671_02549 [Anaerovibrio lipolyticus DSM 3074]